MKNNFTLVMVVALSVISSVFSTFDLNIFIPTVRSRILRACLFAFVPFNMHPQSHMLESIGLVGVAYTHLHGSTQLN